VFTAFIPAVRAVGFTDSDIEALFVKNQANGFLHRRSQDPFLKRASVRVPRVSAPRLAAGAISRLL